MFRRSPPPPPPPPPPSKLSTQQSHSDLFREFTPPPPPPPYPATPTSNNAQTTGLSAGLSAATQGRQAQTQPGTNAALAAMAALRMSGPASTGVGAQTPSSSAGAHPAGATHQRKTSRRQASRDLKELKLTAKELKASRAAEKAHSKKIDSMLAAADERERSIVKILLLGPGESGKSTLFKQIQKNYGSGFDASERKKHHIIVVQNIVRCIKSLIYHSERLLQRLPFSALANSTKAATTTISPDLAASKAFMEALNLYKLFEASASAAAGVEQDQMEDTSVPSPEISPRNSGQASRTDSTNSRDGGSVNSRSTSAAAAAAEKLGNGSLITMNPANLQYGGRPIASVKLNPSGRFIPQLLTHGTDGRSASDIFHEILTHAFLLWADPGLKVTFENRAHFDLHQCYDSDGYFLHKLSNGTLLHPEYIPSDEDLIRVRIRTTAINSIDFKMRVDSDKDGGSSGASSSSSAAAAAASRKVKSKKGDDDDESVDKDLIPMRLLDVAGQRSERKKWIPYFQDATAVIFVAGLSEYDQVLAEDGLTNRLMESIHLFTEIMNSHWFDRTPLVLFLNKCDLFAEKIKRVPLNILFPKYRGGSDYVSACEFLCREFVKRRANPNKVIHIHVVSAIQIDLIATAMDSVKTMIIEQSLGMAGLMA